MSSIHPIATRPSSRAMNAVAAAAVIALIAALIVTAYLVVQSGISYP